MSVLSLFTLPPRPSRRGRVAVGIIVTLIVVAAFWSININWARLGSLPAEILR